SRYERVLFGSYRGSCQVSIRGVVVGAGVGGQGRDDAGCGRGDGGPDGGLLDGGAVEDLDVERGVDLGLDVLGRVIERGCGVGQFVEQGGVVLGGLGGLDLVQLGLEGFCLLVAGGELVGD